MSEALVVQLPLLELLVKVNKCSRNKILKNCDFKLVKAIIECVQNTLNGNVLLEDERIRKLKKYKTVLRKIGDKSENLSKKKKLIVQSGGNFLPILLTPIVSYFLDSLNEKLNKHTI